VYEALRYAFPPTFPRQFLYVSNRFHMFYCGRECQALDWQHGHKDVCRSLKIPLAPLPCQMHVACSRAINPVIVFQCEYIKLCAALAQSCRFDGE
jgi:hypothetical protein